MFSYFENNRSLNNRLSFFWLKQKCFFRTVMKRMGDNLLNTFLLNYTVEDLYTNFTTFNSRSRYHLKESSTRNWLRLWKCTLFQWQSLPTWKQWEIIYREIFSFLYWEWDWPKKPHANYLESCSILKWLIILIKQYYLLKVRIFCCCTVFCWNIIFSECLC